MAKCVLVGAAAALGLLLLASCSDDTAKRDIAHQPPDIGPVEASADVPLGDRPVGVEGVKPDAPATDGKKGDVAAVDLPATELAKIDLPTGDLPAIDKAIVDLPKIDQQLADAPTPLWKSVTVTPAQGWLSLWGAAANDIWAVGQAGSTMRYNGTSWTVSTTPIGNRNLNAVWGTAANDVWAVGNNASVWHYTTQWSQVAVTGIPANRNLHGVWATGGWVWIVGDNGLIVAFNGTTTSYPTAPTNQDLFAIHGLSATDIWAVGQNGTAFHCTAGCNTATPTWTGATGNTGTNQQLNAVWAVAANDVWVAGRTSAVRRYSGATPAWAAASPASPTGLGDLQGIWGTSATNLWFVGQNGTILRYTGTAWSQVTPVPVNALLYGIWGFAANDIWAAGLAGAVVRYH